MNQLVRYTPLSTLFENYFSDKVQKISVHAGFTCPNRDGTISSGGCTYCNNQTFSPDYCMQQKSITEQLREGITFFSHKYPKMKYLAYFQSYTNTYAPLDELKKRYEEALSIEGVVGLVIGTRPDCISDELLDYFTQLAKNYFVLIEYGVESTHNRTLKQINRGHSWEKAKETILRTAKANILQGVHLILGLPNESKEEIFETAKRIGELPIQTLKLHQLQLIYQTRMMEDYEKNPKKFHLYDVDEYINLVIDFISYIPTKIVVERFTSQSPKELLFAPNWGLKNYQFTHKLIKRMKERDAYQGSLLENK